MFARLADRIALKALHSLDAETAHNLTISSLKRGLARPSCPARRHDSLKTKVFDLEFPNPLGMAAGFDKNGEVADAVLKLGFGFTEVGTVTPLPQSGNDRPRAFRLSDDRAVINRYGFNNDGHEALRRRLEARRGRPGVVGVNIGANKDSLDRIADYVAGVSMFADLAAYFTVNISSPNTPGLRELQAREALAALLARVMKARDQAREVHGRAVPVFLKISPDMSDAELDDVAFEVERHAVDGLIVSNTTLGRKSLSNKDHAQEAGGLSGRPLFRKSTVALAKMRQRVGPDLPIIGVGGIDSPEAAWTKIAAGANLLQIYTGMVFEGQGLVARTLDHLAAQLHVNGLDSLSAAVGRNTDAWAAAEVE